MELQFLLLDHLSLMAVVAVVLVTLVVLQARVVQAVVVLEQSQ
jgi:hypothetical protein